MDLGRELGRCQEVLELFTRADGSQLAPSEWSCRASPSRYRNLHSCHAPGASLASRFCPYLRLSSAPRTSSPLPTRQVRDRRWLCADLDEPSVHRPRRCRSPSNARLVRFSQRGEFLPAEAALLQPLDLDVLENLFQDLRTQSVPADGENLHLGFVFAECSHCLRANLSEVQPLVSATVVTSSSALRLCRYRVTKFSLSSKSTLLSPLLSTLVQGVTPSNSFPSRVSLRWCRLSSSTLVSSALLNSSGLIRWRLRTH